jgi:hypothetical protein
MFFVKMRLAPISTAVALLVACGHGGAAAAPKGWQPVTGASAAWTSGGTNAQQYFYHRTNFGGTLQDLASTVTINVLIHHRGARFRNSVPFAPCPGAAGVATFILPNGSTLEEGFAVSGGDSIRTTYIRPPGAPSDPSVAEAMQSALCVTPG